MKQINSPKSQTGFTLIELMVSIVLGLIITASAVQLLLTGQISFSTQKALAEIQESGNFGLRYITNDIRRTNYENFGVINDRLANGGIALTARSQPAFVAVSTFTTANIPTNYPNNLTIANAQLSSEKSQVSNVTDISLAEVKSDQLVIQYYADQAGTDCEGNGYAAGRYIVQRYFLRVDTNVSAKEANAALALACEAGSYIDTSIEIKKNPETSTVDFGTTQGEVIIRRVDYLRFLLGVSNNSGDNQFRYMSISDYLNVSQYPRPRILSIQIGTLIRSNEAANVTDFVKNDRVYTVLDQKVIVKNHLHSNKYIRRVVSQTIALRNGMFSEDKAVM
jgi:type IV pilus assembly protein PilW